MILLRQLRTTTLEYGIAALPLSASLFAILFDAVNPEVVRAVIVILFLSSIALFGFQLIQGLNWGGLGRMGFVAGFVFWYSYPAFISQFLSDVEVDDLYRLVDQSVEIWAVVCLALFLISGIISGHIVAAISSESSNKAQYSTVNGYSVLLLALGACVIGFIAY